MSALGGDTSDRRYHGDVDPQNFVEEIKYKYFCKEFEEITNLPEVEILQEKEET